MIIRDAQIETLKKVAVDSYVLQLADHCKDFSPHLCKTLKDSELHEAIRKGIDWAEAHGFTQRGPVRFYIDMMIVLGSNFDTDPQYPWTAEVLTNTKNSDQMALAEILHNRAQDYLEKVNGETNIHSLKALKDLSELYKRGVKFQLQDFEQNMLYMMKEIHPRKIAETDEESLVQLFINAKKKAKEHYGFQEARSLGLMAVLMFSFGHQCDTDPFLPWISRTLSRIGEVEPETVAGDLEHRARIWLDAVLLNAKENN
jgi:hypothetical protein